MLHHVIEEVPRAANVSTGQHHIGCVIKYAEPSKGLVSCGRKYSVVHDTTLSRLASGRGDCALATCF